MSTLFNLNRARILLVESNLQAAGHIVQLLRGAGYDVQNAYNTGDAFAADHSRFNLALVNYAMKDRQGTSLLDLIQGHATFSLLPLLILCDDNSLPEGKWVLRRPYEDHELLIRIAQLLSSMVNSSEEPESADTNSDETLTLPSRMQFDAHLQQQLGELKSLSTLARSISSVLELSEVLNQIVEAVTTLTHAEEGLLLLPDDEGKALYLRAMKGVDDMSARNFRIKTEDPLVGSVYTSGRPMLVSDKGQQRVKTAYFAKSLLYVPMTFKGQTIGVLGVNNRVSERVFTLHDQELLLDLAAHAAIAIENARLYHVLEQSLADLRQAQATLVQATRLSTMGELAAVVAHQINNPLATIMADSELILEDMDARDPLHDGLTAINRAGKRAHAVVKRLLSTARRGEPSEPRQRINIHETIYNTLELVTTHIERGQVQLDVALDKTTQAFVRAAPSHLEDIWLNLLLNARDALANIPNATISIRSHLLPDSLVVSICDNGPGIAPEFQAQIFDPFFTTKPSGEGTGLGLYICKQIVDQCHGTISVDTMLGKGTCFRVTLPLAG
ncbi:MAG: ATP-binding protein [Chloroflexota bacterium]